MPLFGVDVSAYQPADILTRVPYDFAFIKATEGVDWVSPTCDAQYQSAVARGKLVGVYHFSNAHYNPGVNGAKTEAAFFINNILGYLNGRTILVLDHEEQSQRSGGSAWARAFLDEVVRLTGYKPMLYSSQGHICNPSYTNCADFPLWVANYGNNEPIGYSDERGTGDISPWPVVTCHQYGSQGRLPGYNGNLDVNVFYGDANTWYTLAAKVGEAPVGGGDILPRKTVGQLADEVLAGAWGNGQDREQGLTNAGYNYAEVQAEVNRRLGVGQPKSVGQLANEVLAGQWGNGEDRERGLTNAGYNYAEVQAEVNRRLGVHAGPSNSDIAWQVIRGDWGNGNDRRRRLTNAGYDYDAIMAIVNQRI